MLSNVELVYSFEPLSLCSLKKYLETRAGRYSVMFSTNEFEFRTCEVCRERCWSRVARVGINYL